MEVTRLPAVAGTWYPGRPDALRDAVDRCLGAVHMHEMPRPRAIVAPHAGLMYSGPVAAYAYAALGHADYAAAILVGPSHFVSFHGVAMWPRGAWGTPLGPIAIAEPLAVRLADACREVHERPEAHAREHALEMQLPFIARLRPGMPIVPLVIGAQTRSTVASLAEAISETVASWEREGRGKILLVASSDLSHYHDAHTAARLDAVVLRHVDAFDSDGLMGTLEREPGHACGGGAIVAVMRAVSGLSGRHARTLSYADSGDVSGDKSSVVGYLAAALW